MYLQYIYIHTPISSSRPPVPVTGEETSRAAATGDVPLADSGKYLSSRQSLTPSPSRFGHSSPLPSSLDRRHSPSPVFLRAEPYQLRKNSRSSLSPFCQPYTPKKSSRLVFSRVCFSKHFRLLFPMFIVRTCICISSRLLFKTFIIRILISFQTFIIRILISFQTFIIHISSHFKHSLFVFPLISNIHYSYFLSFQTFIIRISSHFKHSLFVFSSLRESSLQSGRSISRSRTASPVPVHVRLEDTG